MKILALDSSTRTASVAVCEDERTLAVFSSDSGLTQSELLLPMARQALTAAHLSLSDIDLFAATTGPGSFTGVRIGVSVIKGLCFGSDKPCAGVSALEALAEGAAPLAGILCPVIDARRAQVYCALFQYRDGALVRLTDDDLVPIDTLLSDLAERYADTPICLLGDGAAAVRARGEALFPALHFSALPEAILRPSGAAVARCALRAHARGETVEEEAMVPVYLRLPQAERERLAREKENKTEKEI